MMQDSLCIKLLKLRMQDNAGNDSAANGGVSQSKVPRFKSHDLKANGSRLPCSTADRRNQPSWWDPQGAAGSPRRPLSRLLLPVAACPSSKNTHTHVDLDVSRPLTVTVGRFGFLAPGR